jgi:hypothetical protein
LGHAPGELQRRFNPSYQGFIGARADRVDVDHRFHRLDSERRFTIQRWSFVPGILQSFTVHDDLEHGRIGGSGSRMMFLAEKPTGPAVVLLATHGYFFSAFDMSTSSFRTCPWRIDKLGENV